MPELPEVETVKEALKRKLLGKKIQEVLVRYPKVIENVPIETFQAKLVNETFQNITRRGKWILFELDHVSLLSHLRMEGKYHFKELDCPYEKHEHVIFTLSDGVQMRYHDTRKFGKMLLFENAELPNAKPFMELGLEPWDPSLTPRYLQDCYKHRTLPIKTVLLDQKIIAGIGNIYANEILFRTHISPFQCCSELTEKQLEQLIIQTKLVLEEAIQMGGTTVHSYTSEEGVHGRFQQNLYVHGKKNQPCSICGTLIKKEMVGQRGTYYCPNCQKQGIH